MNLRRRLLGAAVLGAAVVLALVTAARVEKSALNATTGFVFLLSVACFLGFGLETAMALLKTSAAFKINLRLLLLTTVFLLFGLEAFLRWQARYTNYAEANGFPYMSSSKVWEQDWLHVYLPNSEVRQPKTEFTHYRRTNSLGLPDAEFDRENAPGEFRLLALGDSYTEGVGTSEDGTWVRVVARVLSEHYPRRPIRALNAGVGGSDPWFEYMLLKERLLPQRPDLVVVEVNTSDIDDLMVRGGQERFRADGTVGFRPAPLWEWLYGINYLFRTVIHDVLGYDRLLIQKGRLEAEERIAGEKLRGAVRALQSLCNTQGLELLVVSHPTADEVRMGRYYRDAYSRVMEELARDPSLRFLDLLRAYARQRTITEETASDYYWKVDRHHNTRGYKVMGESIAAAVIAAGLVERR